MTVTWDKPAYPAARRDEDHVERYKSAKQGSVDVADPYVWLEDVRGTLDARFKS